jgi:WD40 repeat protein
VWAADGSGEPLVLRGHEGYVWSAAFSPDGTKIVTASTDQTARVWGRLSWEALSKFLREKTTACLTPEERMKFLGETASEAWAEYSRCEQGYDRTPVASLRPE